MLMDKATGANGITQEKYVTITVYKRDIEDARAYFTRIGADLPPASPPSAPSAWSWTPRTGSVSSTTSTGPETRAIFILIWRIWPGRATTSRTTSARTGIEKHSDYLKLGDRYCRVLFLKDYANYIQDEIVTNLTDLDRNMMLSIDILNVPTDEAVREVENRLLG